MSFQWQLQQVWKIECRLSQYGSLSPSWTGFFPSISSYPCEVVIHLFSNMFLWYDYSYCRGHTNDHSSSFLQYFHKKLGVLTDLVHYWILTSQPTCFLHLVLWRKPRADLELHACPASSYSGLNPAKNSKILSRSRISASFVALLCDSISQCW